MDLAFSAFNTLIIDSRGTLLSLPIVNCRFWPTSVLSTLNTLGLCLDPVKSTFNIWLQILVPEFYGLERPHWSPAAEHKVRVWRQNRQRSEPESLEHEGNQHHHGSRYRERETETERYRERDREREGAETEREKEGLNTETDRKTDRERERDLPEMLIPYCNILFLIIQLCHILKS